MNARTCTWDGRAATLLRIGLWVLAAERKAGGGFARYEGADPADALAKYQACVDGAGVFDPAGFTIVRPL